MPDANKHTLPQLLRLIRTELNLNDPPRTPREFFEVVQESRDKIDNGEKVATEPLTKLGNIEYGLGEIARAIDYYQIAAKQAEAENNKQLMATALLNLGSVQLAERSHNSAARMLQQALTAAREVGDNLTRVKALIGLGQTFRRLDRVGQARQTFEQAREIAVEHEYRDYEAIALIDMAHLDYAASDFDSAIDKLRTALDIYAQTGNVTDRLRACFNLGLVYADAGRYDESLKSLRRALEIRIEHQVEYGGDKIERTIDEIDRRRKETSGS